MTLSRIFFAGCLSFIAAVGAASFWDFGQITVLAVFVCGIFLLSVFWRRRLLAAAGALLVCCAFGLWVHESAETQAVNNELKKFYGEEVEFTAKAVQEPRRKPNSTQAVVRPDFVSSGNILITLSSPKEIRYGDSIKVRGVLEEPQQFDDFDYASFLAKDGVYAVMFRPEIEIQGQVVAAGIGERLFGMVLGVKHRFREVLSSHIAPPGSTIASAILLGGKDELSQDTKDKLNAAGVRHITAISGMHVAILTSMLMSLLLWVGLWRSHAFYATFVFILLFVVLTGMQPSAIRAGIMGGMFLLGQHLGRQNVSLRALVFAASGMLVANPFLLARDVGFQLSFLAVLGIILFLPIFQHVSRNIPSKLSNLRDIVGMTIAAQILTLPILIFNFGYISLVTIATNLLIVPQLSWFMGFGLVFLLVSAVVEQLGFLLSLPISLFLLYMNWVIEFFSSLPFASAQVENISFIWLVLFYIPIGFFYWKYRKRREFMIQY